MEVCAPMPLVLAIRNQEEVLIVADTAEDSFVPGPSHYGPVIGLPNHCVVLLAGNLEAIRHSVAETALPRVTLGTSAAAVAQLINAALTLELVPRLAEMTGRAEIIVAGIDPIRHTQRPDLYYLDSARNFALQIIDANNVGAGATAAMDPVLSALKPASTHEQLVAAAKEIYSTTKLTWPDAMANHLLIGTLTAGATHYEVF